MKYWKVGYLIYWCNNTRIYLPWFHILTAICNFLFPIFFHMFVFWCTLQNWGTSDTSPTIKIDMDITFIHITGAWSWNRNSVHFHRASRIAGCQFFAENLHSCDWIHTQFWPNNCFVIFTKYGISWTDKSGVSWQSSIC